MTTAMVVNRRVDYTCRITAHTAPYITDYQGTTFSPIKVVAEVFLDLDKARVKLSGPARHGQGQFRSATFNLTGYDKNRPCPEWLVPILRYLGYGGGIKTESGWA